MSELTKHRASRLGRTSTVVVAALDGAMRTVISEFVG